jgi:NAD(P)-dependent dehydrogenase (short-subunit alcohol dehydrogenase family)
MTTTALITGAATGIGNLTAQALARAGCTVYATMRGVRGRNRERAQGLQQAVAGAAGDPHGTLRVIELDVQDEQSVTAAVQTVIDESGQLDVVVHNAGHLAVGYAEAFTADEIDWLFDVNVLGAHRVNRAVLPHMRARHDGYLIYIGSTTSVVMPPFMAPYVATKAAFDTLARTTAYEIGRFGIETTILMPGPFTSGTSHFPDASRPHDTETAAAYAELDKLVDENEDATSGLFDPAVRADPAAVADEVVRLVSLPRGSRPLRPVVDFTRSGVEDVNEVNEHAQAEYLERMGFGQLLQAAV